MDVYLIPIGPDRYELYCPEAGETAEEAGDAPSGFFAGLTHRFRVTLDRIERGRRQDMLTASPARERRRWTRRAKARMLRWITEKIAEQRLLWDLRRQTDATAIFPDDLTESQAMTMIRRMLQRDADRHRLWLIFHTLAFCVAGLLALVPGPNIVAYYFAFRLVGHYLSMRGATHGLTQVTWTPQPSAPLAELRQALVLTAPERDRHVGDIASKLHLPHLTSFFKRIALPGA